MTRFSKNVRLILLLSVAMPLAAPAMAFTNPFTEISAKWCVGEATAQTVHVPAQTDKCRNGAVDSQWWVDSIDVAPGSTVQLDLFMAIRNQVLATYAISLRYDVEGNDLLDFQALSVYNILEVFPAGKDIICAPLGQGGTVDGGCEELTGDGLRASRTEVIERDAVTNEITSKQIFPFSENDYVESTTEGAGFLYNFSALSISSEPIRGTSPGQGGPSEIRYGSVWFQVDAEQMEGATARQGLFRESVDIIIDGANDSLNPLPDTEWNDVITWKTATIPEPGLALLHFSVLATVGAISRRRG